jgi:hypothetical protein
MSEAIRTSIGPSCRRDPAKLSCFINKVKVRALKLLKDMAK